MNYIELDILDECYICMDNINSNLIKLNCCKNEYIHKKCLFILYAHNIENCPLCKKIYSILEYITKKELKTIYDNLDIVEKKIYKDKFDYLYDTSFTIFLKIYKDNPFIYCLLLVFFIIVITLITITLNIKYK